MKSEWHVVFPLYGSTPLMRETYRVTYSFKNSDKFPPHRTFTEYAFENGLRKLLARLKREGAVEIKTERLLNQHNL
jgi:hypothetical protein